MEGRLRFWYIYLFILFKLSTLYIHYQFKIKIGFKTKKKKKIVRRNINLRYTDDATLMAESEEEPFDGVKAETEIHSVKV